MFQSIYSAELTPVQFFAMAAAALLAGVVYSCVMSLSMHSTRRFFLVVSVIPVVGRCIGARDFEQAKYYSRKLMTITYLLNAAESILIIVLMPQILTLYDLSPEAARLAGTLELIHASFSILMWPSAFSLPCSLRAAGDVRFTMTVSIFSMAAFRIVASYILGAKMGMGAIGVWIGMVIDWVFRTALFIWRWRSGKWKQFALKLPQKA